MKEEVVVAITFTLLVVIIVLWIACIVLYRQSKYRAYNILDTVLGIICSLGFGFILLVIGMGELFIC